MRRSVLALFVGCAAFVAIEACTGDDPDRAAPPPDSGTTPDTGPLPQADGGGSPEDAAKAQAAFSLSPARPRVRAGASVDVEVTIDRKGLSGPVTLTASDLPAGVTASSAVVGDGETKTVLELTADANAAVGAAPFQISAAGADPLGATVVVAGPSGALDTSFDSDGIFIDQASATGVYRAILAMSDGSVIVAGATDTSGAWMVKRYGETGAPDAAWNTSAAAGLPNSGSARAIALDEATGKVVVAGDVGGQLAIARFNANGSLDQGFASAGVFVASNVFHPDGSKANGVLVEASSSIVVAGEKGSVGFVERYTAAGLHDPSLSYVTPFGGSLAGIAKLANGAFVAGGAKSDDPPAQIVVRIGGSGGFGDGGVQEVSALCSGDAFGLMDDEDAIVTGWSFMAPFLCTSRVSTGDAGGVVYERQSGSGQSGSLLAVARAAGSASYAAGHKSSAQAGAGVVEKRLADGGFDTTFATAGVYSIEDTVNVPVEFRFVFRAATTTRDGQLVLAGSRTGSQSPGAFILRLWE